MEHFQVADRFARRPHPRLIVEAAVREVSPAPMMANVLERKIMFMVRNEGRGLARFPALRCQRGTLVMPNLVFEENLNAIWPRSEADPDWLSFRGGVNDVVYPGESLRVAHLIQRCHHNEHLTAPEHRFGFPRVIFEMHSQ